MNIDQWMFAWLFDLFVFTEYAEFFVPRARRDGDQSGHRATAEPQGRQFSGEEEIDPNPRHGARCGSQGCDDPSQRRSGIGRARWAPVEGEPTGPQQAGPEEDINHRMMLHVNMLPFAD